ncbi:sensor histidine kinase [Lysobacter korlensis]|uniref:Sensor histidine kinase n=1 Tax=Lysobacter korlensis TaxID=553636 RepID=A0ABV6RWW7_9GAMM
MDLMTRERDRLLHRTARAYGISFTVVSALCLSVPGAVGIDVYLVCLPLYALLASFQFRMGRTLSARWGLAALVIGLGILVLVASPEAAPPGDAGVLAMTILAAASLGSSATALVVSARRLWVLGASFLTTAAVVTALTFRLQDPFETVAVVTLGWLLAALLGVWICSAVPRAVQRIASIGRAHRAERQASELEAQRRQSARLLHDTVLGTLTLLAHSGVGVSPAALRQQSEEDAQLLRQLRLGANPSPSPSAPAALQQPVAETVLGTTLESVKRRFGRMGLEVSWHGTGQLLLPSEVLDAFLLALAECLENVRRHSGVTNAHVTITDDETTVRALVTDSGVGFDLDGVEDDKLGFKESVVGRLAEVGGKARLFSAAGSGTTVVLEVPR